jgi:hypothetical protein
LPKDTPKLVEKLVEKLQIRTENENFQTLLSFMTGMPPPLPVMKITVCQEGRKKKLAQEGRQ